MAGSSCEFCANYAYDEEEEQYYCDVSLDEDEMFRFLSGNTGADEYKVVRHQM